jgi:predicted outer membrane protein
LADIRPEDFIDAFIDMQIAQKQYIINALNTRYRNANYASINAEERKFVEQAIKICDKKIEENKNEKFKISVFNLRYLKRRLEKCPK